MADSLREQLLKAGLKDKTASTARKNKRGGRRARKNQPDGGKPEAARTGEPDLAKAYALRSRAEANERRRAKLEAEREAKVRRERKRKLREALDGKALNKPDAELMRHFEYGGKIRRVHVDGAQLARLNAGELAVVQQSGRYLLVSPDTADKVRAFAPDHIALQVDPDTNGVDEDGVPDDLVW